MIWWLENPARARSARQSVADLVERVSWLRGVRWYPSAGAAFAADFKIEHDGNSIPLTMTYAEFYPNAPPIVIPETAAASRAASTGPAEIFASNIAPTTERQRSLGR